MAQAKTAIITGGGGYLGTAMCRALAEGGWDIFVTYLESDAECRHVLDEVTALGRKAVALACDNGLKADVDRFYRAFHDQTGHAPDLLVNNVGVQTWSSLLDLAEDDWDRVIRTNLKGCFLHTQAAARLMVAEKRPGRIINIGSGCNQTPFRNLVDYTASKGGIEMLTRVAAVELGPYGITVNGVAPGSIETERTRREAPNYARDWSRITPLRRIGTPEDVADAVCFLAGPGAGFITGQTLRVDGGVFTQTNWPEEGYAQTETVSPPST
ncbi:SDR family oxidoreductase [Asticcacaulis sp. EMRT-3]|uniref:SDR family NAD(P)-dependent oxidoreductase n=1 Tax=Asticcacaulis sp. EMRT-3 TaxID=3040349 RepID=UPI0024AF9D3B|nr:SDR family oxidoreductase [Asticcacaulis sp. EMRT-3]MDI7775157.1 SDR family oxidoreductase [Asticcacaulis sp. EMRT-3]